MIDLKCIPAESALLDEKTKETLCGIFGKLTKKVELKTVMDPEQEKSLEMASFLKVLADLNPNIHVELYEPSEGRCMEMDTVHLPVTGLYLDGAYQRVAFHGVPGGKEINSFVIGIYNLAGPGQEIAKGTVKKIEKLKKKAGIQIFVSLSCHHCPGVVIACQRIAMMNPLVSAEIYDGNLYPDLVEQYGITRVPMVVLNEKDSFTGPRSIEDLVQLLKDM